MFAAFLADDAVWLPVLGHPVFRRSLAWLEAHAATAELGNHPLGVPGWYANVHGYDTLPETECLWENHLHTVDLQYLVRGSEGIRWAATRQLCAPRRYREDKDRQEFVFPQGAASLLALCPGMFALFLPGDAHCPKIALGAPASLRKVVIKIPVRVLEDLPPASSASDNGAPAL